MLPRPIGNDCAEVGGGWDIAASSARRHLAMDRVQKGAVWADRGKLEIIHSIARQVEVGQLSE